MENYYVEVIEEISDLIDEKQFDLAQAMLMKELQMPYIPTDVEEQLKKLQKDLLYLKTESTERREVSLETLLKRLHGKPEQQLGAVVQLSERNLRSCVKEIQEWLADEPYPEAAAFMIEALAEQDVPDEFTYVKDGVEYTFWPDALMPAGKTEGFLKAKQLLADWLMTDNPDLYEMARTLLIHEVYMFLPLNYEEEDSEDLAEGILRQIADLMDLPELVSDFESQELKS